MQNVLKSSILILFLAVVGLSVTPVRGQGLSSPEIRTDGSCRDEIFGSSSLIPFIVFFTEECEIILGSTHFTPDTKTYLVLFFIQKYYKTYNPVPDNSKRDWYFHPFSTLGKTKYYVFALRKIIV